jgi:hypothetical protein
MNVSSVTTFGSAAIASPPTNETASAKPNDKPDASPAQQTVEAAKEPGTGQHVDIKV